MGKRVLILSDFVGFGYVAMMTMRSVLTKMGCGVFCLPTAVLSNTLNYGKFAAMDTTEYLTNTLDTWEALGFFFDAVFVGYLTSSDQAKWVLARCRKWREQGIEVYFDPIMGDHGKLYNSITGERLLAMREMLQAADYAFPNDTEAAFLSGIPYPNGVFSYETASEAAKELVRLGCGNVVITGMQIGESTGVMLCQRSKEACFLPYASIPGSFSGAGDLFAAVFLGCRMGGMELLESTQNAIVSTRKILSACAAEEVMGTGIPVERYLELLPEL